MTSATSVIEVADRTTVPALIDVFRQHEEFSGVAEAALADPGARVLVARVGGEVAGVLITRPAISAARHIRGGIDELLVVDGFRGLGLGRALMEAAEDYWRAQPGVVGMQLTVVDGNAPAQQLYNSLGYSVVQRRLRMWKDWASREDNPRLAPEGEGPLSPAR